MPAIDGAETFLQEAHELLDQLESVLLDLERTPDEMEMIDSAFRALHTIKGSGAMFGFDGVADFTHHVENAFELVRKGRVRLDRALIEVALAAKDEIKRLLEHPHDGHTDTGRAILDNLHRLVARADEPVPQAVEPVTSWHIRFRLARDVMTMGTNPLRLIGELRDLGTTTVMPLVDTVPPLEEMSPTDCYVAWDVRLETTQPKNAIDDVFIFVIDDMELDMSEEPGPEQRGPEQRGPEQRGPEPIRASASTTMEAPVMASVKPAPPPVQASPLVEDVASEPPHGRANKVSSSIRVPAERLDLLMDRVGELVIAQSRLTQVAAASMDPQVKSIAEDIQRLALELRDTTMGVRTMPIGSLFGRFRRLAHDLSHELGKDVELVTVGEETELDKTVIERLNDPLVHLIRNALDHGLEPSEARVAAGKSPRGRITLAARHAGAEVMVSIVDDGKGLDPVRIQARAEENGLVAPGAKLSETELFQLIFQPGFSTAAVVTSLSGRGVGMDVVKRTIEQLRGKIDIASKLGQGTELTLRLPLTLAIIDGLLVRVGGGRYVLPLSAVEECVELRAEDDVRSRGRSFLNIRGELVPFLRLRELFAAPSPADQHQKVVIVSAGEQRVGLVVDQVIGNHQTVIKSLSPLHAGIRTFSGATILGDGAVALILEIAHLVDYGQVLEERVRAAS